MVNLKKLKQCPECGGSNVRYSEAEKALICKDCGDLFHELTPEQEKRLEDVSDVI